MSIRPIFAAVPLATMILAGAQCADSAARSRAEAASVIASASAELDSVLALPAPATADGLEQRRSALGRVLQKVQGVRDAGGQESAAALVAAGVQRELALMSLAEAARKELELAHQRRLMRTRLAGALELHAIAEGRDTIDLQATRADVAAAAAEAREQAAALDQERAALEQPINELRQATEADQQEVDRIHASAGDMRREAAAVSPSAGFATFEEAIALERSADQYELRMAQREIDLEYELLPEHRLAEVKAAHAKAMVDGAAATSAILEEFERSLKQDATATRGVVQQWTAQINDDLDAMRGEIAVLGAIYDEAQAALESAISQASRAASGARGRDTDAARVTGASMNTALGHAALARGRGLSDHATLLARLIAAREILPGAGDLDSQLAATSAAAAQAAVKASEALEQARNLMGQVADRELKAALNTAPAAVEAVRASIQDSSAPVSIPMPAGDGGSDAPGRPARQPG